MSTDQFAKNVLSRDGLQGWCRACRKLWNGEHAASNNRARRAETARARAERETQGEDWRKGLTACDRHYFDVISDEERAYWLGFLAADGCVTDKSQITLGLAVKDREHVERFRRALNSAHRIVEYPPHPVGKYMGAGQARLSIGSVQMARALIGHGICPRKSLVLAWPTTVPDELLRHYLRGYFDGDGCAMVRKSNNQPTMGFASNRNFLQACMGFIGERAGLPDRKIEARGRIGYLIYAGTLQVAALYHLLYDGATVWMERKRAVLRPIIETEMIGYRLEYSRYGRYGREGYQPSDTVEGWERIETIMPRPMEQLLREVEIVMPPRLKW